LEIGAGQDKDVQCIFMDTERYDFVDVVADYGKINRVLIFKGKE
jgi:methylase of polypeptide subunit release factors